MDTGSSVTLLHKEVWDNVLCRQNGLVPSTVPIMAVNGKHLAVSGEADVLLQVGQHQTKHKVLVVDNMSQQFILGTDYLEPQQCVINLNTGTLTVGMDSHCVPLYSSKQPSVCHVIVGETTAIPGYHQVRLTVKLSQPTAIPVGIFEPKPELAERHGILLAYSISQVQSGQIAVEVLNPSAAPVALYSKQHVGSLHCVAEVDGISADTESGDVVHAPISRTEKLVSSTIKHMVDQIAVIAPSDRRKLQEWLHRFSQVISVGDGDLGQTKLLKHAIKTGCKTY